MYNDKINKKKKEELMPPELEERPQSIKEPQKIIQSFTQSLEIFTDLNVFEEWFESRVVFDVTAESTLLDCYKDYLDYLTNNQKRLPISKRKFSGFIKNHLKEYIPEGRIRIHDTSRVRFEGITLLKLKEQNSRPFTR
jgi:hypothetical protein